jgi:hypothetical protein
LRIEVHEMLTAIAGGLVLLGCLSIAVWKLILDYNERKMVTSIFQRKKTVKTGV